MFDYNLELLRTFGLYFFPDGWSIAEIGDLLAQDKGISVGVMYPGDNTPDGIPLIKAGDLKNNWVNPNPEFSISKEKHEEYRRTELLGGELLVSLVGNAGQTVVVPKEMCGWNVARAVAVLRLSEAVTPKYLQYCLQSPTLTSIIKAWCNTTVQETLNLKEIKKLPIPLPTIDEQHAIANILGALDEKIELNRKMNQTLEEIAKAIFKSWFVDFDPVLAKAEGRPTGLPPEISDLFPDELVDSEFGEIPKGWATSSLLSLCKKIESGGTPSRKTSEYWDAGTISWFKTGEFCDSPLLKSEEHITPQGLEKSAAKEWLPETILFAMYGATVGKMAYLTETGTANQAVAGINPDEKFGFAFVWQTLISGRSRLMSLANGAAQQNLNLGLVKDFTVTMPSAELARTFSDVTNPIYHRITLLHKESDCLSSLRDTLLPKLISGELRIPDTEKFLEEAGI